LLRVRSLGDNFGGEGKRGEKPNHKFDKGGTFRQFVKGLQSWRQLWGEGKKGEKLNHEFDKGGTFRQFVKGLQFGDNYFGGYIRKMDF